MTILFLLLRLRLLWIGIFYFFFCHVVLLNRLNVIWIYKKYLFGTFLLKQVSSINRVILNVEIDLVI